jgi:Ca-activated chloride channel family protein
MFSTKLDGDRDYRELVPIGPMSQQIDGGQRRAVLRQRIENLPPQGGTGLYDTSLASFQFVRAHQRAESINAVVLLTDGKNEDNGISLQALLDQLRTEQGDQSVRLFTIAYGDDADHETLKRIAETTNGAAYNSSDPTSINQVFTAVISNF